MPRYDVVRRTLTYYCSQEELSRPLCIVVTQSFPLPHKILVSAHNGVLPFGILTTDLSTSRPYYCHPGFASLFLLYTIVLIPSIDAGSSCVICEGFLSMLLWFTFSTFHDCYELLTKLYTTINQCINTHLYPPIEWVIAKPLGSWQRLIRHF